jgi:hypothetical protein
MLRGRPVISQYLDFLPLLSSRLDVQAFPFDEQILEFSLTSKYWSSDDLKFVFAENGFPKFDRDVCGHTEWLFLGYSTETFNQEYP